MKKLPSCCAISSYPQGQLSHACTLGSTLGLGQPCRFVYFLSSFRL